MRLTPRQDQVFRLRCDEGLTRKAVADRLGIALDTVKVATTLVLRRNALVSAEQVCYRLERPAPAGTLRSEGV